MQLAFSGEDFFMTQVMPAEYEEYLCGGGDCGACEIAELEVAQDAAIAALDYVLGNDNPKGDYWVEDDILEPEGHTNGWAWMFGMAES